MGAVALLRGMCDECVYRCMMHACIHTYIHACVTEPNREPTVSSKSRCKLASPGAKRILIGFN